MILAAMDWLKFPDVVVLKKSKESLIKYWFRKEEKTKRKLTERNQMVPSMTVK